MDKKFKIILIALIVIMLAICGYKFYKSSPNQETFNEQNIEDIDTLKENNTTEVKEDSLKVEENLKSNKPVTKVTPIKKTVSKTISNTLTPQDKATESVQQPVTVKDEPTNPVEITEEYKPGMKNTVFYRGVWYNIKVKTVSYEEQEIKSDQE